MNKSDRKTTTVRLDPGLWLNTQMQALREKRDASDIVNEALAQYLSQLGQAS